MLSGNCRADANRKVLEDKEIRQEADDSRVSLRQASDGFSVWNRLSFLLSYLLRLGRRRAPGFSVVRSIGDAEESRKSRAGRPAFRLFINLSSRTWIPASQVRADAQVSPTWSWPVIERLNVSPEIEPLNVPAPRRPLVVVNI